MIPAANRYTAVLDASVLFPNTKRDLLLRFYEADLFRARWTEAIQQEWLNKAKQKYEHLAERLDRTDALMREHFDSAWLEGYEPFINVVELPDPNDQHVVAAALTCKANYIVTDNLKDFPATTLEAFDIEVGSADMFLSSTFDHYQNEALSDLRLHRRELRDEPSRPVYLSLLRKKGLPMLSSRLMPMIDFL